MLATARAKAILPLFIGPTNRGPSIVTEVEIEISSLGCADASSETAASIVRRYDGQFRKTHEVRYVIGY